MQARKNRIISTRVGNSNRSCPFLQQTEIQIESYAILLGKGD